jgi:hypothetical protein
MIWIVLLLFIVFQPGLFLTIPPVGKKWWMSGKTSFTAVVVHAILFALAVGYLLPALEGFSPMIGRVRNPMVGGAKQGDTTSEAATDAAMQVLAEFDKISNATYVSGLVRVTKFSKQVVSGTNTNITLEWAPSKCVKSADKAFFEEYSPGECPPNGRATGIISARIYSQPWTDTTEVSILESRSLKKPLLPPPRPRPPPRPMTLRPRPPFKPKVAYD